MNKIWTIGELLQWTQQFFAKKSIDSPRLDAEILLAHVLQKERIYLYAHYDEPIMKNELAVYRELIKKRAERISVAHILGTKSFMGMDFLVNRHVLIPRPETEMLVETVASYQPTDKEISILDMGTGSGAIILSLLKYLPQAVGTGIDMFLPALETAGKNGELLHLSDRVQWLQSDLFTDIPVQTFDWVVSNPPYLTQHDMDMLQPEVKQDPPQALFGGIDGLEFYRRLAQDAWKYTRTGGHCAVEIGIGQCKDVQHIFMEKENYILDKIIKDYGGIDRVIVFTRNR